MNFFSTILSTEYAKDNIIIQTVTPNQVDTKLARDLYDSLMIVNAADYVRYTLQTVGTESVTNGHPKHKFLNSATMWFGDIIGDRFFMKLKYSYGKKLREQYFANRQADLENGHSDEPLVGK